MTQRPTPIHPFHSTADWRHSHVFDQGNPLAERNTLWAVVLTAVMMVAVAILFGRLAPETYRAGRVG